MLYWLLTPLGDTFIGRVERFPSGVGGRFAAGPDAIMEAINASIGFDKRLAAQDIAGSRAHAAMLAAQGIISDSDAQAIRDGVRPRDAPLVLALKPRRRGD